MTIWHVSKTYGYENKSYYGALPYNLRGIIRCHFKFYRGLFSLIPFLKESYLSERKANKVAAIKNSNIA